jgi:type I restriction enzyme R subunit
MYKTVAQTSESTVVAEYRPIRSKSSAYQSEADLELEFIKQLQAQGYEYLKIKSDEDLIANLRKKIEELNKYKFSNDEWERFYKQELANGNQGIEEKTATIQEDHVKTFKDDHGHSKNITLIDKKNVHNNSLQVINQYVIGEEQGAAHNNRYDVTILVNGLPLVHIELKRRGISIKEAFNQINRYQRDSFWAGTGLFEFIQIFVISNGTDTKYYSNTTREGHLTELTKCRNKTKTSNSFEFTSYWSDGNNKNIRDLVDFTATFFAKHTILNVLAKYCIFTEKRMLMVMRPYQITAAERILERLQVANTYKKMGSVDAGGYIWHTTGSGKTLTSFKTAILAKDLPFIDKVLFVVDRQDLDYQTMREYDKFQKGAANGNKSTAVLTRQLENRNEKGGFQEYKIIVTTIQKLGCFIKQNKTHEIYNKHVVLIFDECHRSHFGELHQRITKTFKNYHIFGFTGTPIFPQNSGSGKNPLLKTTQQAFGDKLHHYTIVNAINDGNVLPFRIDYINTIKAKKGRSDKQVSAIETEEALLDEKRISEIVKYVLDHFDQKTKRNETYALEGKRQNGFNSIFATASISAAKLYYNEFKKQIAERKAGEPGAGLTIATIFSYAPNEEDTGILPEEEFDTTSMDQSSRDFLESAIYDYDKTFRTNFSGKNKNVHVVTKKDDDRKGGDKFDNYYKDLSDKMKTRQVDLLIVVNMFLTGFDATTLNTLWVDKNLRQHGLLQAYSRTNRILNSVKTFGNIICFRSLQAETDEAIALFGDKDAGGVVILKTFKDYYEGYTEKGKHVKGYLEIVAELESKFPLEEMTSGEILGEKKEKEFIQLYGALLRLRNILTCFDEFKDDEFSARALQDYQSVYLNLYEKYKPKDNSKESIKEDVEFEIELIKQIDITIDYILELVAKYHKSHCKDKEIRGQIEKAVNSSIELRSKKELIEAFLNRINTKSNVDKEWREFVRESRDADLDELIKVNKLNDEKTRQFLADAFRDGSMSDIGTGLPALMPKKSLFAKKESGGENRSELKNRIFALLKGFFDKYFGICSFDDAENAEADNRANNIYQLPKQIGEYSDMKMAADKNKSKNYK